MDLNHREHREHRETRRPSCISSVLSVFSVVHTPHEQARPAAALARPPAAVHAARAHSPDDGKRDCISLKARAVRRNGGDYGNRRTSFVIRLPVHHGARATMEITTEVAALLRATQGEMPHEGLAIVTSAYGQCAQPTRTMASAMQVGFVSRIKVLPSDVGPNV